MKLNNFYLNNLNMTEQKNEEILPNDWSDLDNHPIGISLKETLLSQNNVSLFVNAFKNILDILSKSNISLRDFLWRLNYIKYDENISTNFFKNCHSIEHLNIDPSIIEKAKEILNINKLGPICFLTPELGRWSTIGGLGVMVDELSQGLRTLGQEVIMISPYYDRNRKGEDGYLARDPLQFKHLRNVEINLDQTYTFGVHGGEGLDGIKYYFLHNFKIFPRPYPEGNHQDTLRQIACFGKASLQLLCDLGTIPELIVTNDWFTGLAAGYAKTKQFGDTFNGTSFFHIIHNLEPTYEGRIYPDKEEGTLEFIHHLPSDILVDPYWKQTVINPSRCAIIMSDNWGTVSPGYRDDLKASSPLASLLNQKPYPFAFPNGIFKEKRLKVLREICGNDRKEIKRYIQKKYFGYGDADFNVPLYSFVGRLTAQKGVMLILDVVEELINKTEGKINILLGGKGDSNDPYVAQCINKINYLRGKYPYAFWANPNEFFTDGPKVNFGSDFGLMPSLFEPGGLVQQEFFVAGTPVIAFRTGGLKSTVYEFHWDDNKGNGLTFDTYNGPELVNAFIRSINLFKNKEKFEICRKNAFNSCIDVITVATAWCREFDRLRGKIFFNRAIVFPEEFTENNKYNNHEEKHKLIEKLNNQELDHLKNNNYFDSFMFNHHNFSPINSTQKHFEYNENLNEKKEEKKAKENKKVESNNKKEELNNNNNNNNIDINNNNKEKPIGDLIPVTFNYEIEEDIKPKEVSISGTFYEWNKKKMKYDIMHNKYTITLNLKKGKYLYKYFIDGKPKLNYKEKILREINGFENNYIEIE